ncbi:MAG: hypothetical protein FWC70_13305 [Defluviitaleaceae bacterium]|nr:hypothetical protein [Defluviitaleaceae bacterium]
MKKNVGFIAVGQGGGNIGLLFEKMGYSVLFMNTSQEDLATLTDAENKYHVKDGEGCNKDRDKAKDLIIGDFDAISEKINETLTEEYIYVIFSSGGGTGSGSSPMLIDLLIQHTDKKVGAITIMPAETEPLKAYINAYECFKELESISNTCATFILDNNKYDKFAINKDFADLFNSFLDIPNHQSKRGNIDTAEIKELLSTRGAAIISRMTKATSSTARLIAAIKENIFAPLEADKVIKYIGLSAATEIDLDAVMSETGTYVDAFQGTHPESTVCIFCGLSFPYTSLEKIRAKVEDNREAIGV